MFRWSISFSCLMPMRVKNASRASSDFVQMVRPICDADAGGQPGRQTETAKSLPAIGTGPRTSSWQVQQRIVIDRNSVKSGPNIWILKHCFGWKRRKEIRWNRSGTNLYKFRFNGPVQQTLCLWVQRGSRVDWIGTQCECHICRFWLWFQVFALDSKIFEPFPPVNLLCFHPERFVRGICVCGFVIWHLFRRTLRGGSKASSRSNRNNSLAITSVATVLQDFSLSLSHLFTVSLCLANPAAFSVFSPSEAEDTHCRIGLVLVKSKCIQIVFFFASICLPVLYPLRWASRIHRQCRNWNGNRSNCVRIDSSHHLTNHYDGSMPSTWPGLQPMLLQCGPAVDFWHAWHAWTFVRNSAQADQCLNWWCLHLVQQVGYNPMLKWAKPTQFATR